jgi:hypothetical protein
MAPRKKTKTILSIHFETNRPSQAKVHCIINTVRDVRLLPFATRILRIGAQKKDSIRQSFADINTETDSWA